MNCQLLIPIICYLTSQLMMDKKGALLLFLWQAMVICFGGNWNHEMAGFGIIHWRVTLFRLLTNDLCY